VLDTLFPSLSSFEAWIKGTKTGVSELAKLSFKFIKFRPPLLWQQIKFETCNFEQY